VTVKGTNFRERKLRLTIQFLTVATAQRLAAERGDTDTVQVCRRRARLVRLAWQRLDDHIYGRGR
jgi:hypothetical protein